jgi:hypothetical protein
MKFTLKLIPFFTREARTFISTYKRLIMNRQGIDLDPAPSNKQSTINRKGFNHWMVETLALKNKGFKSSVHEMGFSVFASKEQHPSSKGKKEPVTYEQLFTWHNQKHYSGVFGNRLPRGSQFYQRLVKEVDHQLRPQIVKEFTQRIKVQL